MPAAVAVPLALAGVSLVANNVQNKAAQKNNDNQQAAAVANTTAAYDKAQSALNPYLAPNATPSSSWMTQYLGSKPQAYTQNPYAPANVNAGALLGNTGYNPAGTSGQVAPWILAAIAQAAQQQKSTLPVVHSPDPTSPPPVTPPIAPRVPSPLQLGIPPAGMRNFHGIGANNGLVSGL